MKYVINIFILLLCNNSTNTNSIPLATDREAYAYCMNHKKSFIAIVWPVAQGQDAKIKQIFNEYGQIKYQKNVYFTHRQAFKLLKKAHPHIQDMHEHVNWYFPSGTFQKPARIFVVKFKDTETAVACKHAIRHLFSLQYRSIHINDTHSETIHLAQFFFNTKKVFNDPRIALKVCPYFIYVKLHDALMPVIEE